MTMAMATVGSETGAGQEAEVPNNDTPMTAAPDTTPTSITDREPSIAPLSAHTSLKRARLLFDTSSDLEARAVAAFVPPLFDPEIHKASVSRRMRLHYHDEVRDLALRGEEDEQTAAAEEEGGGGKKGGGKESATLRAVRELRREALERLRSGEPAGGSSAADGGEGRLVVHREQNLGANAAASPAGAQGGALVLAGGGASGDAATAGEGRRGRPGGILVERKDSAANIPTPKWHAPWRLSTVLASHLGWVRSVAFDPTNTLFASGGGDRVIKVFDLAKACVAAPDALKITLTGHISPVRGLAFSDRHPYLFSAGEDKMVKCWDLETNQVIRHYHGHLSGVFALKLHPTLDLLVTGGRDAVARVWDMRTKHQIHCLTGHDNTVGAILTKATDPQVRLYFY